MFVVAGIKTVEPAVVKPVSMKSATVEPATAVETSATAMRVGEVWLARHSGARQRGYDCQSPFLPRQFRGMASTI
jgi:hypothetical protein